ncbi:MAG: hypothetical protein ACP5IL_11590 [Syntrophobacteraceae bacterium]
MIPNFPSEFSQMVDAPRDYHINGKAGFKTIGTVKPPVLDSASVHEHSMINFDTPAFCIPIDSEAINDFEFGFAEFEGREPVMPVLDCPGCNRETMEYTGIKRSPEGR